MKIIISKAKKIEKINKQNNKYNENIIMAIEAKRNQWRNNQQ